MDILDFIYWYFYGLENVETVKPVFNDACVVISSNDVIISVYLLLSGQICTEINTGADAYTFYFAGTDKTGLIDLIQNIIRL